MDKITIFEFALNDYKTITLTVNIWLLIIAIVVAFLIVRLMNWICENASTSSIAVDEFKLGIGDSSITLKYNHKEKEIAYKLWIELNTRKIGLEFEEDYDVISEVYDSWYKAFDITRQLIKEVPSTHVKKTSQLIKLTTKFLNVGLRPHLTKWQAKYRRWYKYAIEDEKYKQLSPQEIQRKFPEYNELLADLKRTNKRLIHYKEMMENIAFK